VQDGWALPERQYNYVALIDLAKKLMSSKPPDLSTFARSPMTNSQETIFLDCAEEALMTNHQRFFSAVCSNQPNIENRCEHDGVIGKKTPHKFLVTGIICKLSKLGPTLCHQHLGIPV